MKYNVANTNNNLARKSLFDVFFGDRFYNDFFGLDTQDFAWMPSVDIVEHKDKYVVSMDIPGINEKDINIELKDSLLTVSGERKEEKVSEDATVYKSEKRYGTFSRTFNVADVDEEKISAEYKNGVLNITLPKKKEKQARKISIKAN